MRQAIFPWRIAQAHEQLYPYIQNHNIFCTKIQLTLQTSETVIFVTWVDTRTRFTPQGRPSVLTAQEIKWPPESDALSKRKIPAPDGNQTLGVQISTGFVYTQLFSFNLNIIEN
jgi:hypothetical protein